MNANIKMSFKNNYHVELIDSVTGNIKQSGDFHNLVVNGLITSFVCTDKKSSTYTMALYNAMMFKCAIGSGTTKPSSTDTTITTIGNAVARDSDTFEWLSDYAGRNTCVYTFPANSSYVGTVTEVGLYNYANKLTTHALLTDSEGQQISFIKTELDILKITVTVELTLSSSSSAFKLFRRPYIIRNILAYGRKGTDRFGYDYHYGVLNLIRFYADLDYYTIIDNPEYPAIDYALSSNLNISAGVQDNTGYVTYSAVRVPNTDITSERYYKALAIPGVGYWKLPNEDIFPAYTISGIAVGVGDGSKTQFTNPLCYFKKDTDKVYKNGVMLTRGVDYTINNVGNSSSLPEVSDFIKPSRVFSDEAVPGNENCALLLCPSTRNVKELYDFSYTFSSSNPLYIEYDNVVTFNCLKCTSGLLYYVRSNGRTYNVPIGSVFYVDYSLDGETYIEAGSVTLTSAEMFTCDFPDTAAKYWRIRTSISDPVYVYNNTFTQANYFFLFEKDPYITFTEAPADGDVITMDVDMDVIMKNSNFVVEAGCRLDFTL